MQKYMLISLVLISLAAYSIASEPQKNKISWEQYKEQLSVNLARQSGEASVKEMMHTICSMRGLDSFKANEIGTNVWQDVRELEVRVLLKCIKDLTQMIPAEIDPKDYPVLNVAPPPETGLPSGVSLNPQGGTNLPRIIQLPAGVSPSDIKDPVLRKQYERQIEENKKKAERCTQYSEIRREIDPLTTRAMEYIAASYSVPRSDISELKSLLETSGLKIEICESILHTVQKKVHPEG